ncbi:MAG: hypothetical protein U0Q11_21755 [Vicinamibacterales bacterium]
MTEVAWMVGVSLIGWLAAWGLGGSAVGWAVWFGMLGPLVAACVSWVLFERTYRRDAAALTGQMVTAFALKFMFFGAYVAVLLKVVRVSPVPFVVSFSSYFIALHLFEAVCLKRLFSGPARS